MEWMCEHPFFTGDVKVCRAFDESLMVRVRIFVSYFFN